jgi:hypothetical protein
MEGSPAYPEEEMLPPPNDDEEMLPPPNHDEEMLDGTINIDEVEAEVNFLPLLLPPIALIAIISDGANSHRRKQ